RNACTPDDGDGRRRLLPATRTGRSHRQNRNVSPSPSARAIAANDKPWPDRTGLWAARRTFLLNSWGALACAAVPRELGVDQLPCAICGAIRRAGAAAH